MTEIDRIDKQRVADGLEAPASAARRLAEKLGLEPYDVNYWIVDNDEMNELIAYNGFQTRYPHWRWGMQYDRQRKQNRFLGGKAFEIVNNDDPAHAFLQESNDLADQKAVITHVEAHSDFFANNRWFALFRDDPDAAAMLERHARTIEGYMEDPEIERSEVEAFVDSVLCLEDNIAQHRPFADDPEGAGPDLDDDLEERLADLGLTDEVVEQVFDEEWLAARAGSDGAVTVPEEPREDLLAFLREHGMAFDEEAEKAVEFEDWQRDVIDVLRRESYYFAPQKMTKVMNEGWAAYWESKMMGDEAFADDDEFVDYADHQARVLNSPGFNPYKLGKQLWEYVENVTNRREVAEHLLRVEGVTWRNFHDAVDFDVVREAVEPPAALAALDPADLDALDDLPDEWVDRDAVERARSGDVDLGRYPWEAFTFAGLAARHYSLAKRGNRGFVESIGREDLERVSRYLFEDDRYATVEAALEDVDRAAGWERMYTVRESHNDVTFIDEFLTQEFVDANDYFTYEYSHATGQYHATSTAAEDVKKKLLLRFTNLGKPTVAVYDGNFRNRNELLLGHQYNGVALDVAQARETLRRVFDLWGRPVALKTIVKELDEREIEVAQRHGREPEPEERGVLIRYDGESFEREALDWDDVEDLAADDVDYDTKPEDWLA